MKTLPEEQSVTPFPLTATSDDQPEMDNVSGGDENRSLPEGWTMLPTRLGGTRLYRVTSPHGGDDHWLAEMTLNGKEQRRRCASELYARWWLSGADERHDTPSIFDGEDFNERLRAGFARGRWGRQSVE